MYYCDIWLLYFVPCACSCRRVFSGGRFNCSCNDLDVLRSTLLVLMMNLTVLFCVRCSEIKLVVATMWLGTAGYIYVGGMRVVNSLSLFLVLRCLNLFSLLRFVFVLCIVMCYPWG